MNHVQKQYERFPYPPVSVLALPRKNQGRELSFEFGANLVKKYHDPRYQSDHQGKRILVAGCGTLEVLVCALKNPLASEIVAVDLSPVSIRRSRWRIRWHDLSRLFNPFRFSQQLPPIKLVAADLHEWHGGLFDYIMANNMLQHVPEPEKLFERLAGWLKPNGLLRVVTYPYQSRLWMRLTARFFQSHGLYADSKNLISKANALINQLPETSPIRQCYLTQPERHHVSGLVDAFFHACEKSLPPIQWKMAADRSGLSWIAEAQAEDSRSSFLDELDSRLAILPAWIKLQILDDVLEVCDNPVLWFLKKTPQMTAVPSLEFPVMTGHGAVVEQIQEELKPAIQRLAVLLKPAGLSVEELAAVLKEKVGCHVFPGYSEKEMTGMTFWESINELII